MYLCSFGRESKSPGIVKIEGELFYSERGSFFSASDVIPHDRTRIPILAQRAISTAAQAFPLQPRHFHCSPGAFPPQHRHFHCSPGAFPLQPRNLASKTKCQHSSSLKSSIKKRHFVIFERVPMTQPGLDPGTIGVEGERLIHYSIEEVIMM